MEPRFLNTNYDTPADDTSLHNLIHQSIDLIAKFLAIIVYSIIFFSIVPKGNHFISGILTKMIQSLRIFYT